MNAPPRVPTPKENPMFISRKRHEREMQEVIRASLDIEDQMPKTTVAYLRILAGYGDDTDEQILDNLKADPDETWLELYDRILELAYGVVEAHQAWLAEEEAAEQVVAEAEDITEEAA
jgi:hypothetical protein